MDFFDKTLKELKAQTTRARSHMLAGHDCATPLLVQEAVARGETSRQATVTDDRITKAGMLHSSAVLAHCAAELLFGSPVL
eukprot:4819979-Amphidinium_carterae.2